nr:hypothetical protein [Holospora elegans]
MKVVIDAVDKIHGDVVPGLVEKLQHTLAKLFGRDEKSIHRSMGFRLGLGGKQCTSIPLSFAAFWVSLLVL